MATALREARITPADQLRRLVTESEELVVRVRGSSANALRLVENLDQIAELWPKLEAAGVDLRGEAGRWETLRTSTTKHGQEIVRAIAPLGGLQKLRRERHGDGEAAEWWYLQERLAALLRRRLKKTGALLAVVLVVGVAISVLFKLLFPVDPAVRAAFASVMNGQQKIERERDLVGAVEDFRAATEANPIDPETWLWLGSALQATGGDDWEECFERARALSDGELVFHLARAPVYTRLEMWDEALGDLEAALAIDSGSPEAHYFLATVYESQGRFSEAMTALERASEFADERGSMELVAMSRYRLGMMMQGLQAQSLGAPNQTALP